MGKESKIVAKVEDKVITEDEVLNFIRDMGPEMANNFKSEEGIKSVINELVHQELMYLDAEENKIYEEDEFKKALEATRKNLLKSYAFSKIVGNITATEEDAKEYYEKLKDSFITPDAVTASHILVDEKNTAEKILEDLKNDGNFEELAKEYSTCPSKEAGGKLGTFYPGQMVEAFDKKVFEMEEGEISDPVKTEFGYHIIKLEKKIPGGEKSFEEVKEQCMKEAQRVKQQKVYLDKMNELQEKYSVTLM
ncbi:MAG: peptidylprolyl isomerase [Tissierellia bacterium]|nr:peptidylprolyl isomerase [Tissierellia bacterium]